MFEMTQADLKAFALGAAFLGTGGGGDTYIARLMLQQSLASGKRVFIKQLEEFSDDTWVAVVNCLGSPAIMTEKIPAGFEVLNAVELMQAHLGKKLEAIVPLEIGGLNSILPMFVGAELSLPVVNAEGMARAFPEVQMTTYSIYGQHDSELTTIANEHGETVLFQSQNATHTEKYARTMAIAMGGMVYMCYLPMTIKQLKQVAIPDTMRLCLAVGQQLQKVKAQQATLHDLFEYFSNTIYQKAQLIHQGKIIDVQIGTKAGFTVGRAKIQCFVNNDVLTVTFQNEHLIAALEDKVLVCVPDLICILDKDTCEPITCESLRYGQRVNVIALRAPEILRTERALAVVGPQAFGLTCAYHSI